MVLGLIDDGRQAGVPAGDPVSGLQPGPEGRAPPILSVSGLSVSFRREGGWLRVVDGITFDVRPRETLAVVGGSGSGKSVTALACMGLLPRRSSRVEGQVTLGGRNLLTLPEALMRQVRGNEIAMVFQEPMTSLNPVLTIGRQVSEALVLHRGLPRGDARAEAVRLLDRVRIPAARSRLDEHPHSFSGGMRQRVMIAMALACRPRLLIADEPTTALDVTVQAQVLELIRTLQDEDGMSVLFITHDMGVVAEVAERTVVMHDGHIVEAGPTEAVFGEARHPYTRSLLAAVPRLGSTVRQARNPAAMDRLSSDAVQLGNGPGAASRERPLLEVSGLTTRFEMRSGLLGRVHGRVHAVENVSFDLDAGETLALVGESGCGKSTTGRSVLRLTEPLSGSVTLNGVDLLKLGPMEMRAQRRRIQMIFQDPFASLNPRQDVGTAIAQPLLINRLATAAAARDRVATLLRDVGLAPEMATRFPHEFSGGQRQRICIARALAVEPQVIVADEAVSALDVSIKAQVIDLFLELQQRNRLAYLFISHDMAAVERISHRVAVMHLGEIVEIGPCAAVFGNPQHPYTRRLLAAVPVPDPARRLQRRAVPDGEPRNPIKPPGFEPAARRFRLVSPGHSVMNEDDEPSR